ncbi:unnamed protein product [Didymodactylos carnosus]|uniref:Major facilitator superfamily (MFS) profile domain-containing protein n=1 Tax=Didymodactylos carnosus TaxID=1234261 RepID=A0A815QLL3_9BILA|nr:unnamed protein product [Didymodactylos carnosus]CAF4334432.1 unnamed protein product [Didymodactylos carnosus]
MRSSNAQVYIIGCFAAIGGLLFGYDIGVISGVLTIRDFITTFGDQDDVQRQTLRDETTGSIVGILQAGCFIGALCAGQAAG